MNTTAAVLETGLTARKPERSAITYAIVASIVMHVLVLAWFPGIVDILKLGRFDPPPIVAQGHPRIQDRLAAAVETLDVDEFFDR